MDMEAIGQGAMASTEDMEIPKQIQQGERDIEETERKIEREDPKSKLGEMLLEHLTSQTQLLTNQTELLTNQTKRPRLENLPLQKNCKPRDKYVFSFSTILNATCH